MVKELERIAEIWPIARDTLSVPHTGEDYRRLRGVLDRLTDEVGEDEDHPLASLMETVGALVEVYESEHEGAESGEPTETLKYLMQEHGLGQGDLPELGDQGAVCEILAGQRGLSLRQIRTLAKRFSVSPAVFV